MATVNVVIAENLGDEFLLGTGVDPTKIELNTDDQTVAKAADGSLTSPITSMTYDEATSVITYVDEAGLTSTSDLSDLLPDNRIVGGQFDPAATVLTLVDEDPLTPDVVIDLSDVLGPSTDPDNLVNTGTDKKAFIDCDDIMAASSICTDPFGKPLFRLLDCGTGGGPVDPPPTPGITPNPIGVFDGQDTNIVSPGSVVLDTTDDNDALAGDLQDCLDAGGWVEIGFDTGGSTIIPPDATVNVPANPTDPVSVTWAVPVPVTGIDVVDNFVTTADTQTGAVSLTVTCWIPDPPEPVATATPTPIGTFTGADLNVIADGAATFDTNADNLIMATAVDACLNGGGYVQVGFDTSGSTVIPPGATVTPGATASDPVIVTWPTPVVATNIPDIDNVPLVSDSQDRTASDYTSVVTVPTSQFALVFAQSVTQSPTEVVLITFLDAGGATVHTLIGGGPHDNLVLETVSIFDPSTITDTFESFDPAFEAANIFNAPVDTTWVTANIQAYNYAAGVYTPVGGVINAGGGPAPIQVVTPPALPPIGITMTCWTPDPVV